MPLPQQPKYKSRSVAKQRHLDMLSEKAVRYTKHGKKITKKFANLDDGRIAPNRKWFGNSRVITQKQVDEFRAEVERRAADPREVILKQRLLPMELLTGPKHAEGARGATVTAESFAHTFGRNKQRNRPTLSVNSLEELAQEVERRNTGYDSSADRDHVDAKEEAARAVVEMHEACFGRGQTARVFGELYKVIDCSDVIMEVLDARDPLGTRSATLEAYLKRPENSHKHLILILNKCDFIPPAIARRWVQLLSREYPTVAFRASIEKPFGKGTLIGLLRQFVRLHQDKKQITVGLCGYPNVGKSSLINSLTGKPACPVAPIPGQTKVWQYVTLTQHVYLVDCPGVVYPSSHTERADLLLRGVIRPERIQMPSTYIGELLKRGDEEAVAKTYSMVPLDGDERSEGLVHRGLSKDSDKVIYWIDSDDFLERLAKRNGRLLKGAEPDVETAATMVIRDWQRGRIPFFYLPPNMEKDDLRTETDIDYNEKNEDVINHQASDDMDWEVDPATLNEAPAPVTEEPEKQSTESSDSSDDDVVDWHDIYDAIGQEQSESNSVAPPTSTTATAPERAGKPRRIHARDIQLYDHTIDRLQRESRRQRKIGRAEEPEQQNSRRRFTMDDPEFETKANRQNRHRKEDAERDERNRRKKQLRKAASTRRRTGSTYYDELRARKEIITKRVGHRIF